MSSAQPPIFVVGATGTVGRRVVNRLVDRGQTVRAATRSPGAYKGPEEATAVSFDYLTPETWADGLGPATRVFMMTPADTEAYGQLVPFLDLAAEAGVRKVVFMTSMGMDQAPDDLPQRSAELALMDSDLDATILRPNWFMQNFTSIWRGMIEADGVMRLPAGDAAMSFIDADDIAAVAEAALVGDNHAGEAYAITGPEALTHDEAAEILSNGWGCKIRYEPVSDEDALEILTRAGLDEDYAEILIGVFQMVRAGHFAPVTSAVETVTGHPPRSLKDFAEATAEKMA